jgi:lipoate-protein ligase A
VSPAGSLRWIPPLQLSGCWQMAIDEWLLDRALAAGSSAPAAVLRFYTWSRPTLSLGYHQRCLAPRWLELAHRGELQLVRRPSGGRAVLHAAELTYALVWPQAPARRREAYQAACAWLQRGFTELGLPLRFGAEPADPYHPSCFASSTAADLVHDDGGKRIGSAQLWRQGVLLQHGSILLRPDRDLWRRVLGEEPPRLAPLPWSREWLIAALRQAARAQLPIAASQWSEQPLTPAEWTVIAARRARYRIDPSGLEPALGRHAVIEGAEPLRPLRPPGASPLRS